MSSATTRFGATDMAWCWVWHRWTPWMWFGADGLEVRSCYECRTLQWRGGAIPIDLLRAAQHDEEPRGA